MAVMTIDRARTQANWLVPMALVTLGSLAAWKASEFTGLHFRPFQADAIMGDLTALFLISLFLERTLEVFLATWRDFGRVQLQQEVDRADGAVKAATDAKAAAEKALAAAPGDPKAVAAPHRGRAREAERCALRSSTRLGACKTDRARLVPAGWSPASSSPSPAPARSARCWRTCRRPARRSCSWSRWSTSSSPPA
jgi:hypothetical protein